MFFKLALRNIFRQKARSLMTLAAIVLGVTGLALSGGFVEDVFYQLREATIHSHLGHIQVYRSGYSSKGRRDPFGYLIENPSEIAGTIQALPDVADVLPRLTLSGLLSNGRADMPVVSEAGNADREAHLGRFVSIIEGRSLANSDVRGMMVGQGVASRLNIASGDEVTLLMNTPEWGLNSMDFTVVGIFQTISKEYDDNAVRINIEAAHELTGTEAVHALVLALDNTAATDHIASRLRELLPADTYEIRSWHELADFYTKVVDLYNRQFLVLQFIVLVMVLLSVANSVNMAVFERTGEFGTLRALGDRRGQVFALVVTENLLLGIIGALMGISIGMLLAWAISAVGIPMPPPPNTNSGYTATIRLTPTILLLAFVVGLVATVLASLLPAWRVSRIPVAEALREN
jgi:putative ABC transport system permease protein